MLGSEAQPNNFRSTPLGVASQTMAMRPYRLRWTTAVKTIKVLRRMFAANGLPEHVVTDNGPQFVSEEFVQFLKENGIKHTRSAPYHPASNGLAERFVQSLKTALKTSVSIGLSLSHRLSSFLLTYQLAA